MLEQGKLNLPIVFLDMLFGGVEIIKEDGEKLTHSLPRSINFLHVH